MADRASRIKLRVENKDYEIVGDNFEDILAVVKALPKRRFNPGLRLWEVDGSLEMLQGQVENSGFVLQGGTPVSESEQSTAPVSRDQIKVEVAGYSLLVSGGSFREMLEAVKAIPGRRFDGETKQWSLPGTLTEVTAQLEQLGFAVKATGEQSSPPAATPPTDDPFRPPPAVAPTASAPVMPPPPPSDMSPPDAGFFISDEEAGGDFWPPDDLPPLPPEADPAVSQTPAPSAKPAQDRPDRRDQIRVMVENTPLAVVGGSFQAMLAAVKEIPGRRFDGQKKQWLLDSDLESVRLHLEARGFQLDRQIGE